MVDLYVNGFLGVCHCRVLSSTNPGFDMSLAFAKGTPANVIQTEAQIIASTSHAIYESDGSAQSICTLVIPGETSRTTHFGSTLIDKLQDHKQIYGCCIKPLSIGVVYYLAIDN